MRPQDIPTAPGKLPGLGHVLHLVRRPLPFMRSLRGVGDLAWVHLGPQRILSVNTPELIHRMLVTDGRKYDQGKYFDKIRDTFGNGLPVSNGEFHLKQRRLIQPAFHHKRINGYLQTMSGLATSLAESWQPGQVVPMRQESLRLTLGMVARTLFSADVGAVVHAEVQRSWDTVVSGLAWRTMSPTDLLEKIPTPGNRRYVQATKRLQQVVTEAVLAQRANGEDRGSLLDMLLAARDEETGEGMSDEQVVAEIFLMLFAGTETAAYMMVWLFFELSRNPEMERRLHDEVDSVLAGRPVEMEDIGKLEFTRQLLTESLRLYHPGWMFMRRSNTEIELDGHTFPAGTDTVFSLNALHQDPATFPDPTKFDPDRWTAGAMDEIPEGGFIPFLEGRRQCIGDSFAWAEMTCTVAAIASRWRLTPPPGHKIKELAGALMAPSETPMTLTAR